jgi:hypothetical protein
MALIAFGLVILLGLSFDESIPTPNQNPSQTEVTQGETEKSCE